MNKLSILENKHYNYNYKKWKDIKLYDGTSIFSHKYYLKEIKYEKKKIEKKNLTKLIPSTSTANANFKNLNFKEQILIKKLVPPKKDSLILLFGCNYGEVKKKEFDEMYAHIYEKKKKSNKGRKPKQKKIIREKNGTGKYRGKYFSSQITAIVKNTATKKKINQIYLYNFLFNYINKLSIFHRTIVKKYVIADNIIKIILNYIGDIYVKKIYLNDNLLCSKHKKIKKELIDEKCDKCKKKLYKIKIFRNGNIQIPGVLSPTFDDILLPLLNIQLYFQEFYEKDNIKISYIISEMRNYACKLIKENQKINLMKLKNSLELYKKNKITELKEIINIVKKLEGKFPWFNKIYKYWHSYNEINLAEININNEKCSALLIKFYRPTHFKLEKKLTIKVLKSGKINFHGGFSELEIYHVYYWLENFFIDHDDIFINKTNKIINISDSDSSSCENSSIYDDML